MEAENEPVQRVLSLPAYLTAHAKKRWWERVTPNGGPKNPAAYLKERIAAGNVTLLEPEKGHWLVGEVVIAVTWPDEGAAPNITTVLDWRGKPVDNLVK